MQIGRISQLACQCFVRFFGYRLVEYVIVFVMEIHAPDAVGAIVATVEEIAVFAPVRLAGIEAIEHVITVDTLVQVLGISHKCTVHKRIGVLDRKRVERRIDRIRLEDEVRVVDLGRMIGIHRVVFYIGRGSYEVLERRFPDQGADLLKKTPAEIHLGSMLQLIPILRRPARIAVVLNPARRRESRNDILVALQTGVFVQLQLVQKTESPSIPAVRTESRGGDKITDFVSFPPHPQPLSFGGEGSRKRWTHFLIELHILVGDRERCRAMAAGFGLGDLFVLEHTLQSLEAKNIRFTRSPLFHSRFRNIPSPVFLEHTL